MSGSAERSPSQLKQDLTRLLDTNYRTTPELSTTDEILRQLRISTEGFGDDKQQEFQATRDQLTHLLTPSKITTHFREVIIERVRTAFIREEEMSKHIKPVDLGFEEDSLGIYDSNLDLIKSVEGMFMRKVVTITLTAFVSEASTEDGDEYAIHYPKVLAKELDHIEKWRAEFRDAFNDDPFEGRPIDITWASRKVHVATPGTAEEAQMQWLGEALSRSKKEYLANLSFPQRIQRVIRGIRHNLAYYKVIDHIRKLGNPQ